MKKILFFACLHLIIFHGSLYAKGGTNNSEATLLVECSDIEIFYSEKGIIKYKLVSSLIEKLENNSVNLPNGGTVTGYNQNGEIEFTAHANSATSTEDNKIWTFEGDVFLEVKNGRLETDKLNWDRDEKMLSTKSLVRISNDDSSIVGDGLFAKQDLSHYEIEKPRGTMAVDQ